VAKYNTLAFCGRGLRTFTCYADTVHRRFECTPWSHVPLEMKMISNCLLAWPIHLLCFRQILYLMLALGVCLGSKSSYMPSLTGLCSRRASRESRAHAQCMRVCWPNNHNIVKVLPCAGNNPADGCLLLVRLHVSVHQGSLRTPEQTATLGVADLCNP